MKLIAFSLFLILLLCNTICAETVITEGTAFIGSGITLEEAKVIALNDAKQKALNSLGVFVESESKVVNGRLTKDEIRSITGAVMGSEILESSKQIIQDAFVLKVKVKCNISNSSLQSSLERYKNRNRDKKTIDHLISTIGRLQKEIISKETTDTQLLELVDEINYSNERLNKLLTTKQMIGYELQMQNLYKNKVIKEFKNCVLPSLDREFRKFFFWNTVPTIDFGEWLKLKFVGCNKLGENYEEYFEHIDNVVFRKLKGISKDYELLKLNVRPELNFNIQYEIAVSIYINDSRFDKKLNIELKKEYSSIDLNVAWSELSHSSMMNRFGDMLCHHFMGWYDISLPKNYTLSNIEDIHIRVGKVKPQDIKFCFFY